MIGIDWGTSSFRAYRLHNGQVIDRLESSAGIMHVQNNAFAETLRTAIAPWLADGETRALMSGMISSRQGWVEADYLPCPANAATIAASLTRVDFEGCDLRIVPGLSAQDSDGTPEIMRGEETQIIGSAAADGLVCLPGSHAKWAKIQAGQIDSFTTYLSGEAFSALRTGTILGRTMNDAPHDPAGFDRGVQRSADTGHLLHHLFGVRTQAIMRTLTADAGASYLSGLLIGHEIRAALPPGGHATLLGTPELCALYARAIAQRGGTSVNGSADSAARGLVIIGELAQWI